MVVVGVGLLRKLKFPRLFLPPTPPAPTPPRVSLELLQSSALEAQGMPCQSITMRLGWGVCFRAKYFELEVLRLVLPAVLQGVGGVVVA